MTDKPEPSFQDAANEARPGLVRDFVSFMRENRKWWLTPFLVVFALLALALVLHATGALPFLYTMF